MNYCWLFNIGIEDNWSVDRFKMKDLEEDRIVQHMEIVGIDSIVTEKEVFPIIEINVRFTLFTYLSMLPLRFPDRYLCSMYYRIFLSEKWNYTEITKKLAYTGIAFDTKTKEGIFCYNHACVDRDISG